MPITPSNRSRTACPPTGWSTPPPTAPTASKSASSPTRRDRRCCRRSPSRALKGAAGDYRVYALAGAASGQCRHGQHRLGRRPQGKADAVRLGTRRLAWRWPRRCPGGAVRPAMSASPTAGSSCNQTGALDPACQRAEDGNVALTGEIGFSPTKTKAVLALGFGATPRRGRRTCLRQPEAGLRAAPRNLCRELAQMAGRAAAAGPARRVRDQHLSRQHRGSGHAPLDRHAGRGGRQPVHPLGLQQGRRRSRRLPSGLAARPGRDGGRLPRRRRCRRRRCRSSTICAPSSSRTGTGRRMPGSTASAYWPGIQMDECAFPLLLADALRRAGASAARQAARPSCR